jgi:hypothetical protein
MSLRDDKQQNIQSELDFSSVLTGEARDAGREGCVANYRTPKFCFYQQALFTGVSGQ